MKDKYIAYCKEDKEIPLFMKPWWLEVVSGKHDWDALCIEDGGNLQAAFVYILKKKGPFTSVGMPELTSFLGFWFADKISQEQADELLTMLPKHDKFYIQMSYNVCGLNLEKYGFDQQVRHTYTLSKISNHDKTYSNFKQRIKGEIKKAEGKINAVTTSDAGLLYALCEKSYKRQGKEATFTKDLVQRIYNKAAEHKCGVILLAEDAAGNPHAATLLVWDQHSAYYLLNGGDPDLRSSGANSLLMWESIKYASQFVDTFDFEGSMIPGVEKYIQGYNPEKKQYALFTKTSSKIVAAAEGFKKVLGK